jgi:Rrf2 family cysteine metabolism transcriptional repressor
MRISTKGRYGLRAIIDIAIFGGEGQVSIRDVAERQGISDNYLEQIIYPLKKAGIVHSVRGAQGGYYLARPAAQISAGDVLRALEGDLAPVECLAHGGPDCARSGRCPTLSLWMELRDAIDSVVDGISIEQLAAEERVRLQCAAE